MTPSRTALAAVSLALVVLATPLGAQQQGAEGEAEALNVFAYTLRHQPAADLVELVRPLLSPRGTVELQPGDNTLVVRDSLAALARIVPVLRSFDHPPKPMRLEIMVVHASTSRVSPTIHSDVPARIVGRLRQLWRYETFKLAARADLKTLEGQQVIYEMGDGYGVRFHLGTLVDDRRIKLRGFQVTRGEDPTIAEQLIHTNLNLELDQTVVLALARQEGSPTALIVVLTCRDASGASGGAAKEPE